MDDLALKRAIEYVQISDEVESLKARIEEREARLSELQEKLLYQLEQRGESSVRVVQGGSRATVYMERRPYLIHHESEARTALTLRNLDLMEFARLKIVDQASLIKHLEENPDLLAKVGEVATIDAHISLRIRRSKGYGEHKGEG